MKTFSKYISEGIFDTIKGKVKDILFGLSFKYYGEDKTFITVRKDYKNKNEKMNVVIKYKKVDGNITSNIEKIYVNPFINYNYIEATSVKDLEDKVKKMKSKNMIDSSKETMLNQIVNDMKKLEKMWK